MGKIFDGLSIHIPNRLIHTRGEEDVVLLNFLFSKNFTNYFIKLNDKGVEYIAGCSIETSTTKIILSSIIEPCLTCEPNLNNRVNPDLWVGESPRKKSYDSN